MKVAIQLHGQPRYIKESYEYGWKKLIEKYDADVYIHSWFDDKQIVQTSSHHSLNDVIVSDDITKQTLKNIIDIYNPISFRYDTPLDFEKIIHPYMDTQSRMDQALYGQHVSAYYANKLRVSSKYKYDVILKSRIDIMLTDVDLTVQENTIKIPYVFTENSPMMNPALDYWAIGTPEVISKSCDIINNFDYFFSNGIPAQSEFLVHLHLIKEKLKIERVPHNFVFTRDYIKYGKACFPTSPVHFDHFDIFGRTKQIDVLSNPLN